MENKRKLTRRHLIYYLNLVDVNTGQPVGQLVDITKEGLMLKSEMPLKNDQPYHFRMVLPAKILNRAELVLSAKVIWCKKDNHPDYYAGFRLVDMTEEDEYLIDDLVYLYGFNN